MSDYITSHAQTVSTSDPVSVVLLSYIKCKCKIIYSLSVCTIVELPLTISDPKWIPALSSAMAHLLIRAMADRFIYHLRTFRKIGIGLVLSTSFPRTGDRPDVSQICPSQFFSF